MTDSSNETTYGLVLSFEGLYATMAEERAFVNGFELGKIWLAMRQEKPEIAEMTHRENQAAIDRAAASQGYEVERFACETEGWDFTKLRKVRPEKLNPHGLRVVKS